MMWTEYGYVQMADLWVLHRLENCLTLQVPVNFLSGLFHRVNLLVRGCL